MVFKYFMCYRDKGDAQIYIESQLFNLIYKDKCDFI